MSGGQQWQAAPVAVQHAAWIIRSGHHLQNRLARIAATAPFHCSILFLGEDADGAQRAELAQPGFYLVRAVNVREAKQIFAERPDISVVIIDLETTGADGAHLVDSLSKENPQREWVEYVILSGRDTPEIAAPLDPRMSGTLSKPLGPGQLLAAVTESYNAARLRQLNHEEQRALDAPIAEFQMRVGAAASQLLAQLKRSPGAAAPVAQQTEDDKEAAGRLRALINEEQMRARLKGKIFGALAYNHARWMLLLVLSEAFQTGQEATIKAAAYRAGLPLSSALRRLNEMCLEGLAVRRGDPADARRSFVSLTPLGQSYFVRYEAELRGAKEAGKPS